MEETALIRLCLKGDNKAQRVLFDTFAPRMMAVCRRYGKTQQEAEDMLQEGFIRLFRYLHQYQFAGSFEGWVRRIFVNTAIKYYNKQHKHHFAVELDHLSTAFIRPRAPENLSEEDMLRLIRTLPAGYQMVFNLYVIEGYNHKEIAEMLGIGESTSRSQLVKARKMLQKQISLLQTIAV